MPKRARSHELEEQSLSRFNALLPSKWVSRAKLPDYGIDREVEIFDDDGNSTGLMFLVQLRATDDVSLGDRVRLEADELAYYEQLELPVMVMRYCSVTNSFYWQWAARITSKVKLRPRQMKVTYRFGDAEQWTDSAALDIRRTLEVRRAITNFPSNRAISVRLNQDHLSPNERYQIERTLSEAIAQCSSALVYSRTQSLVEVIVTPKPNFLAVQIDALASVTLDLPQATPETIATSMLYAIVHLLHIKRLVRQAELVAQAILARNQSHHSEELPLSACKALIAHPLSMVDLAILNDLHQPTSSGYAFMMIYIRQVAESDNKDIAEAKFFAKALEAAGLVNKEAMAPIYYSIGNHYRNRRKLVLSIHHYNCARRFQPAYLQRGYFLHELAGVLFESRRYCAAIQAYEGAYVLNEDPLTGFLLGDAFMMAGKAEKAILKFEETITKSTGVSVQEAELKRLICQWLIDTIGSTQLPRQSSRANAMMRADGFENAETLWRIIHEIDSLHPLAHFNVGVQRNREGTDSNSIVHFLICAFVQPNDIEAWANAAICALAFKEPEIIIAVLTVAVSHAGLTVYDRLRAELITQNAPTKMLETFDGIALELMNDIAASVDKDFTLRLVDGDQIETLTISI